MSNGDKPAFAHINATGDAGSSGLTKREYFAIEALKSLIQAGDDNEYGVKLTVQSAIKYSDELLNQLEEK